MIHNTRLIHITPDAERHIVYCARVSSPNQDNPSISKLIRYCIKHRHWSIFEMASMCVEITTSRAITAQICRHKSFAFQEFSQRYAPVPDLLFPHLRSQDKKNRQNSIDDIPLEKIEEYRERVNDLYAQTLSLYGDMLEDGVAKECARFILPMSSMSKLYMYGSIRSWIHYLEVRTGKDTQLEHREIAEDIKAIFQAQMPVIYDAAFNTESVD